MNVGLTDSERKQLRQWQKQRRDNDGYVKVTVLLLDKGRSAASIADDLAWTRPRSIATREPLPP